MHTALVNDVIDCALKRWSPGIGDPTAMGWVTVGAYLVAGALSLAVASRGEMPPATARRERRFWAALGAVALCLAVNKQLDLQSFLTATGRCVAQIEHWYAQRRTVQRDFIYSLLALSGGVFLMMLWAMRLTLRRTALAVLGATGTITFVLVRAIGFHHVDQLINYRVLSMRMNWVLELSGLVLIVLGALFHPRRKPAASGEDRRER